MVSRRNQVAATFFLLMSAIGLSTAIGNDRPNLLTNGRLEKDTDEDGVPDGWVSHPHHFSRETLGHVQAYIAKLPTHEKLLEGKHVQGSDGWVMSRRESKGNWGSYVKSSQWYAAPRVRLPQP